jgi:hypothetical protein
VLAKELQAELRIGNRGEIAQFAITLTTKATKVHEGKHGKEKPS